MAHEYHKFRFEPLALESKPFSAPVDRMYAYDHLEWVQDLWPTSRETLHRDQKIGVACALMKVRPISKKSARVETSIRRSPSCLRARCAAWRSSAAAARSAARSRDLRLWRLRSDW